MSDQWPIPCTEGHDPCEGGSLHIRARDAKGCAKFQDGSWFTKNSDVCWGPHPTPGEAVQWTPDFYEGFRFEGPFEDGSYGVTVPMPDGRRASATGDSIAEAVVNVAAIILTLGY